MTIAQPECLSEETHSQNKVAFGLECKIKQTASPSNNVLNTHKIREKEHRRLATLDPQPQCDPLTLRRLMTGENGMQKSLIRHDPLHTGILAIRRLVLTEDHIT